MALTNLKWVVSSILFLLCVLQSVQSAQECLCCYFEGNINDLKRCKTVGTPLNRTEVLDLKSKQMGSFCDSKGLFQIWDHNMVPYQHNYVNSGKCAEFFDDISDLFYWVSGSVAEKYANVWKDTNDYIVVKPALPEEKTSSSINAQIPMSYFRELTLNPNRTSFLVIKRPSLYQMTTESSTNLFSGKKSIVDLGTFSFFNPTDDYQNYSIIVDCVDKMEMNVNSFTFFESGIVLTLVDGEVTWQGETRNKYDYNYYYYQYYRDDKVPIELQKHFSKRIPLSTPLAPGTSVSGRVFAHLTYTHKEIWASLAIDGKPSQVIRNGAISMDVYTFEHVNFHLEAVKVTSRERQIFFASYIAALAGIVTTLILGCAIFTACLVAQKRKNKRCVCPKVNIELNLARKKQFIAEKAAKAKEALVMAGGVCGSICNCMYHQVAK
ncbi:integral component of membrane [Sergentomyia squamirostris]